MTDKFSDPVAPLNEEWDVRAAIAIDDGVRAPTAPTGGANEYVRDEDKYGLKTQEWSAEDIPSAVDQTVNWWRLWWYIGAAGVNGSIDSPEIRISNVWQGTPDSTGTHASNAAWNYAEWTDEERTLAAAITGMGFRFTSSSLTTGDQTPQAWGVYIQCNHDDTPPEPGGEESGSAFLLFL